MDDKEKSEDVVRHVTTLDDGTYIIEYADGRLERVKSETDWVRLAAMNDEDIDTSDAPELVDWSSAKRGVFTEQARGKRK
jgi:hypothetical protein